MRTSILFSWTGKICTACLFFKSCQNPLIRICCLVLFYKKQWILFQVNYWEIRAKVICLLTWLMINTCTFFWKQWNLAIFTSNFPERTLCSTRKLAHFSFRSVPSCPVSVILKCINPYSCKWILDKNKYFIKIIMNIIKEDSAWLSFHHVQDQKLFYDYSEQLICRKYCFMFSLIDW